MSRIRCFVAAAVPGPTCEQLGVLQKRLTRSGLTVRWVRPEAMHLTLKFIGEITPETFDQVIQTLSRPLTVAGPLNLQPKGVGVFPPGRGARVVWAGLDGDVASLAKAALEVEARLQRHGIERERRPFRPHLTLGRSTRLGGMGDVQSILEGEAGFEAPAFAVHELVLYESRLRPEGASHIPRLTVPLSDDPYHR